MIVAHLCRVDVHVVTDQVPNLRLTKLVVQLSILERRRIELKFLKLDILDHPPVS